MLSCKQVVHRANDYLDQRLSWYQRLMVHLHLLICVHCRRFLAQLPLASRIASAEAQKPCSEQEVAKVVKHIDQHNQ